jgi:hypothetical protein
MLSTTCTGITDAGDGLLLGYLNRFGEVLDRLVASHIVGSCCLLEVLDRDVVTIAVVVVAQPTAAG